MDSDRQTIAQQMPISSPLNPCEQVSATLNSQCKAEFVDKKSAQVSSVKHHSFCLSFNVLQKPDLLSLSYQLMFFNI